MTQYYRSIDCPLCHQAGGAWDSQRCHFCKGEHVEASAPIRWEWDDFYCGKVAVGWVEYDEYSKYWDVWCCLFDVASAPTREQAVKALEKKFNQFWRGEL